MSSDVIAITGGSGFIGLSLIEHLLRAGHTVLAHSMDPLPALALSEFARLPGQLTTVQGDIRDGDVLRRTRPLPASATYTFPLASTEIPCG